MIFIFLFDRFFFLFVDNLVNMCTLDSIICIELNSILLIFFNIYYIYKIYEIDDFFLCSFSFSLNNKYINIIN